MKTLPFKPRVPGIRTLWVLKFNEGQHPLGHQGEKGIEFFIPSPFSPNEWIQTNLYSNALASHFLENIQKSCEEIKEKCRSPEELKDAENYIQKSQELFGNLARLEKLMTNFNRFMKKNYGSSLFPETPDPKQEPDEEKEKTNG